MSEKSKLAGVGRSVVGSAANRLNPGPLCPAELVPSVMNKWPLYTPSAPDHDFPVS